MITSNLIQNQNNFRKWLADTYSNLVNLICNWHTRNIPRTPVILWKSTVTRSPCSSNWGTGRNKMYYVFFKRISWLWCIHKYHNLSPFHISILSQHIQQHSIKVHIRTIAPYITYETSIFVDFSRKNTSQSVDSVTNSFRPKKDPFFGGNENFLWLRN